MFAEVKKNATNWTITIKDLSTGANCSPANQSYSGQQSSIEWIAEDPSYSGGGLEPLTNYGTVSFLNDTQNGANPQLNYSTDSVDMVQGGTVVSSTSQPNPNTNGFSVAYGSTAPSAPTTSWTNEGNMSNGQSSQQSVLLPDGKVLIAGGQQSSGDSNTKHTQIFTDGTPGSWAAKADMNAARNNFILQPVTISGGGSRVLAAGGVNSSVTNTAELYNESANTWTSTPNMNAARFKHASSILSDGRVLVTGGSNNANETTQFTSTEIYDPVANTWTTKASMNTAREEHLQVTFTDSNGNSKVMVIGGYKYGTGVLKSTEIYDPSTDTWSAGPDMAYTRDWTYNPTNALLLHDGRILVVGGDYTNDSEVYNPSTNTWTTYATPLSAWGGVATLLGSGANYNVLYAGSFDTSNFKKAMLFNPSTNSWSVTYSMNTARGAFTLVTLTSGNVVAAGGQNSTSNEINNTEEYTP